MYSPKKIKKKRKLPKVYSSKKYKFSSSPKIISWLKWFLVFVFILGCFIIVSLKSDLLKIKQVNCHSEISGVCQLIQAGAREKSLLNLNEGEIEKAIKTQFPQVKKIAFIKRFPLTLEVKITRRIAVAALVIQKIERTAEQETIINNYFLVDEDSILFQQIENPEPNLPILEIKSGALSQENVQMGMSISQTKNVSQLLRFVQVVGKIRPRKITVGENEITLLIGDNLEVLLALGGEEILVKIKKLEMILKHYQEQGISLRRVDLRFDKPVVVY